MCKTYLGGGYSEDESDEESFQTAFGTILVVDGKPNSINVLNQGMYRYFDAQNRVVINGSNLQAIYDGESWDLAPVKSTSDLLVEC